MPNLPDRFHLARIVSDVTRVMCDTIFVPSDPLERGESLYRRLTMISMLGAPNITVILATDNDGGRAYNVIAELPGTDPVLRDEVVMIGGHLDSWHTGVGATDNADGVATVMVKEAVSRHAANSVAPAVACRMIREEVPRALARKHAAFTLRAPVTLEVDFAMTIHADMAELCPGARRTAGRTVAFTHQDYGEVFRAWRTLLNLSAVV